MRRHIKDDETIDDRENPEIIDEDEASDKADDDEPNLKDKAETDDSDIDVEEVEEAEEGEEEGDEGKEEDSDYPWRLLTEEEFERCQSEFDERVTKHMARQGVDEADARKRVYDNMLPTYRKALANIFVNEMLWFHPIRKDLVFLSLTTTVSDLKLLDDYDNEEVWKSAVDKRTFLFDRILKEYDPPELPGPEDDDDNDTQTEKVSKENTDQVGEGSGRSSKLNFNLVSPSEQVALREKDELLREGRKRGFSGFTPEDAAEIAKLKKPRSTWVTWTVIQKM